VISFAFDNIKVRLPGFYGRRRIKVAIDGEIAALALVACCAALLSFRWQAQDGKV